MSDHQHVNGHDEPVLGIEERAQIALEEERMNFLDVAAIAAMQGIIAKHGMSTPLLSVSSRAWEYAEELWLARRGSL